MMNAATAAIRPGTNRMIVDISRPFSDALTRILEGGKEGTRGPRLNPGALNLAL